MHNNLNQINSKPEILVFKTNIETERLVKDVSPIFDNLPSLKDWSVDTEDIDNVLRIVTEGSILESDIIDLLLAQGFYCEALED